jgi:ribosomal protein S18 acetylase RimI-like enzyme
MDADVQLIDDNLHEALRVFGRAHPKGCVEDIPESTLIFSGTDYSVFNMAVLRGEALQPPELAHSVKKADLFFRQLGQKWSLWACEERMDLWLRGRYKGHLRDLGLRELTSAPGMVAERLTPPRRPMPELEIQRVGDAATRSAFAFLASVAFDIPSQYAKQIYGSEQAWRGSYEGYVAFVNGNAVCCMAIVETPGAVGVYTLGTPPQWQRRGFGEALLRRLVEPRLDAGKRTLLQSSEAGLRLYRRLGYRAVSRYGVFLTR